MVSPASTLMEAGENEGVASPVTSISIVPVASSGGMTVRSGLISGLASGAAKTMRMQSPSFGI